MRLGRVEAGAAFDALDIMFLASLTSSLLGDSFMDNSVPALIEPTAAFSSTREYLEFLLGDIFGVFLGD